MCHMFRALGRLCGFTIGLRAKLVEGGVNSLLDAVVYGSFGTVEIHAMDFDHSPICPPSWPDMDADKPRPGQVRSTSDV